MDQERTDNTDTRDPANIGCRDRAVLRYPGGRAGTRQAAGKKEEKAVLQMKRDGMTMKMTRLEYLAEVIHEDAEGRKVTVRDFYEVHGLQFDESGSVIATGLIDRLKADGKNVNFFAGGGALLESKREVPEIQEWFLDIESRGGIDRWVYLVPKELVGVAMKFGCLGYGE
jgi:hypothetical protein